MPNFESDQILIDQQLVYSKFTDSETTCTDRDIFFYMIGGIIYKIRLIIYMNPTTTLLDIPIKDVAAQIFRRPCLFVNPTAHIFQIATYLAIGPQIYVDGLIVINESKKPIGIISSKHIIFNIINTGYPEWLKITAEQIMDDFAGTTDMNSPLSKALKIFDKTRFAFVPIIARSNNDKNTP